MADTFQIITGLPEDRPKVYNLAGKTTDEAMKMLRYLKRNAFFGTHTGLPKEIRNSKINESLISNIGDYSVLDVYAYPQTKCIIGTVVNFHISNDVNSFGITYVYPCTDKNKPMGYMISDATPDKMGVCLVHGVLEVPLYYFSGSTEEKKDFVEYDIENSCFKFADSGYPVFNVYQDVDGDWIAIILFGDVSSDYVYDGPFAVSVSGITGSTMFVDMVEGDVLQNGDRATYNLTEGVGLSTGESLWLGVPLDGSSCSFVVDSNEPVSGGTTFYRIAENDNMSLYQFQYGDIWNDNQKIYSKISGNTAYISLTGNTNSVKIKPGANISISGSDDEIIISATTSGGGGSDPVFYVPPYNSLKITGATVENEEDAGIEGESGEGEEESEEITGATVPDGLGHTFILPVKAGTVGFWDDGGGAVGVWTDKDGVVIRGLTNMENYNAPSDGYLRISVIDGGTSYGKCLSFFSPTGGVPLYKYGEFGKTPSIPYSYSGSFKTESFTIPSEVGEDVIIDGSSIGVAGDTVTKYLKIYDSNNRDPYYEFAGYVQYGDKKFDVPIHYDTYEIGDVIYLVGTYTTNANNDLAIEFEYEKLSLAYFPTISDNQFYTRICYIDTNGEIQQTQYGDIIQPVKLVGDGETTTIIGNTIFCSGAIQDLSASVDNGVASIALSASTNIVKIKGAGGVTVESDGTNSITLTGSTSGGGGIESVEYVFLGSTPSISNAIIEATVNKTYVLSENLYGVTPVFTENVLKNIFPKSTYPHLYNEGDDFLIGEDTGDILVKLPTGQTAYCMIKFYLWGASTSVVIVAPDGKGIIDDGGSNVNSSIGFSSNGEVVFIYDPAYTYDDATGFWRYIVMC